MNDNRIKDQKDTKEGINLFHGQIINKVFANTRPLSTPKVPPLQSNNMLIFLSISGSLVADPSNTYIRLINPKLMTYYFLK